MENLIEKAQVLAEKAHHTQKRKTDGSPYIEHPLAVGVLLAQHGCDEVTIAAGIVHDVLEDTQVTEDQLRRELGDAVADIVCAVSENKTLSWEDRKQQYIDTVSASSKSVKMVSVADKVHNLQDLIAAHAALGTKVWKKFNRGKEKKLWFERTLLQQLQKKWNHPLLDEYARLIDEADRLAE